MRSWCSKKRLVKNQKHCSFVLFLVGRRLRERKRWKEKQRQNVRQRETGRVQRAERGREGEKQRKRRRGKERTEVIISGSSVLHNCTLEERKKPENKCAFPHSEPKFRNDKLICVPFKMLNDNNKRAIGELYAFVCRKE